MAVSEATLSLPNGARFYRCAFQVNPYEYLARHQKATPYADESSYNAALIEACLEHGVEVVAITDHYRIKSARKLIAEVTAAGLTVFPGFEAVSKDGVHFLCLFEPGASEATIERVLGACGVEEGPDASPVGAWDALELMHECHKRGIACIAAHVVAAGGLLRQLRGRSAANAWKSEHLTACSISGPVASAPQNYRPILENKNGDYRRERPAAVLNARDVTDPTHLGERGALTLVKMSHPTLDGLREAFLDPESRVRLMSDPEPPDHVQLLGVEWTGGFLDGCGIRFNENLNVLVGGRGSGKSTVIESIRYVLGSQPVGPDATKSHKELIGGVLRNGTKISLALHSPHPAPRTYIVERTIPNPPIVRDDQDTVLDLAASAVVPGIEIYGQHEISELARSPENRTRLLDRFLGAGASDWKDTNRELKRRLSASRVRLIEALKKKEDLQRRLEALPALKETLRRFEEVGLEKKLEGKSQLVTEEQLFVTAVERVEELGELIESLREGSEMDRAFVQRDAIKDLPNNDLLRTLGTTLASLEKASKTGVAALDKALATALDRIQTARTEWDTRATAVEEAYEKTLRELQKENIDGAEFIRLRQRAEALEPLRQELKNVNVEIRRARTERTAILAEWEEAKAERFRDLQTAARRVGRKLKGEVRVTVAFQGDRTPLEKLLRERVGGRLTETFDELRRTTQFSLRAFSEAAQSGTQQLVSDFRIPELQAARLAAAGIETLMEVEELDLWATTQLELNVARKGSSDVWRALEDLSAGQKATAVLLLLLLESDTPLIVDQPEDDLDNRFITDSVVPKLREEKPRRQFLLSTHNANLPVLGDAELIIELAAEGEGPGAGRIPVDHLGSIDDEEVRKVINEVLEGGKEAFELRRLKYGF